MNRFQFLGAQTDASGQEWCYVLDTQTYTTLKSPVKTMGGVSTSDKPVIPDSTGGPVPAPMMFSKETGVHTSAPVTPPAPKDPAGEIETVEDREKRLKGNKVPPAFLGDIRRMNLDPSKTDGRTDVTPTH